MEALKILQNMLKKWIENLTVLKLFILLIINLLFLTGLIVTSDKIVLLMADESIQASHDHYDSRLTDTSEGMPRELSIPPTPDGINDIDIQFNMKVLSISGNNNAFQTADDNRGIRMEFDPSTSRAAIIVGSTHNWSVFWLSVNIELNQDYLVHINVHNQQVTCTLNGLEVLNTVDSSLNYIVGRTVVGSGFSQTRPFDGEISNFIISYSAKQEPVIIKALKALLAITFIFFMTLILARCKVFYFISRILFQDKTNIWMASSEDTLTWYKSAVASFLKDMGYILPLLLTTLVGFAFMLTHLSIGADDTCVDRYFDGNYLLAQNRITGYLVNRVLHVYSVKPFVPDFLSVLMLSLSALIFCAVFKKTTKNKLHPLTYTIFSCIFVSFPLLFEILIVMGANLNICLGYLLTSISLIFALEILETKKKIYFLIASVLVYFTISCYESFAAVYLCAITALLTLKYLFGDDEDKDVSRVLMNGLKLLLPLLIALVIYKVMSIILGSFIHLPNYAATGIAWSPTTFFEVFTGLWKGVVLKFVLSGLIFQPITSLCIAMIMCIVLIAFYMARYRKVAIVLILLAMLLSIISLSILQGYATFYRSCQVFAFFTGFILCLTAHQILSSRCHKVLKNSGLILISILIFRQANDLNNWFYVDYMRAEEEKTMANLIAYQIKSEFDINKPVLFTGGSGISDNINQYLVIKPNTWNGKVFNTLASRLIGSDMSGYKFVEGDMTPIYGWAIGAFGEVNTEILKYFKMNGHTFKRGTMGMFVEAIEISTYKPVWPAKGSIFETPSYIVVHL